MFAGTGVKVAKGVNLCQDVEDGVQGVAQHVSCVALGRTSIMQRLNGIVQVLDANLSHHSHQHIPGIISADQAPFQPDQENPG